MIMRLVGVLLLAASCGLPAVAAETKSGLQPGETTSAFYVQDVTGPRRGGELCYACAFGRHAVVNIQAREMTDTLVELLKQLDALVDDPAEIRGESKHAFFVLLTDDPDAATEQLTRLAKQHGIQRVPLTFYDDPAGPEAYRLSEEADITIMMWDKTLVTKNFACVSADLDATTVKRLISDARQHLQR